MTAFRRNPLSGDPILFAPGRAGRPRAFIGATEDERCPFCPGHESDTPPQVAHIGDPWRVRVVPNKYPPADGAEVVIESPDHDARFDTIAHGDELVWIYAERHRAHAGAAYVALFKNEGAPAGSSISHVHSQLVPLPFVPPRVERERRAFTGTCPLCEKPELVISETERFVRIAPLAASLPYQQWIVPKRHVGSILELRDAEIVDLADMLRSASATTRTISDAYNWAFVNTPHFYVDLFPRLTTVAGLELGTGTFVEIVDPAVAAERLRS